MKRPCIVLSLVIINMFLLAINSEAGATLNKQLPQWINMDIQLRHRYEWRSNFDFNDAVYDKDGFNLWRGRFGLMVKPSDDLKFFYQFQDSRISDDSITGSKAAYEDWAETRQLWVEAQTAKLSWDAIGLSGFGMKVGRQELSYGSLRLIGPVNWSNVGQTFDAGKLTVKFDAHHLTIDAFGGSKTLIKSPREQNDFYEGSANERIAGYYAEFKGIKDLLVEQYLINRNTEGKTVSFGQTGDGEVDDFTIGARIKGKVPETSIDYEFEAAKQVGKSGALDVDAQMAVAIIGYTFDHSWKPRAGFEFDYASGDGNSTDQKRKTFDNLYPTNHIFYGYMDFVSLQNIHDYRFVFNVFPFKKLELEANWHMFYLDSPKDNLYAANQTVKRSTAAGADDHVGNEIDLLAKYKICDYADFWVGYSHLFAGNFLADTGSSDDADFVYVQTTLSF